MSLLDQLVMQTLNDPAWQQQQQQLGNAGYNLDTGTASYMPIFGSPGGSVDAPTQGPITGYYGINDAKATNRFNDWSIYDAQGNPTGGTQSIGLPKGGLEDYIPLLIAGATGLGMAGAFGGIGAAGAGAGDAAAAAATTSMGAPAATTGFAGAGSDAAFNAALAGGGSVGGGAGFTGAASDAAFNTAVGGGTAAGGSGAAYLGDSTGFAPAASDGAFNSAIGAGTAATAAGGAGSGFLNALPGLARGVTDLIDGNKLGNTANNIAEKSDPFAQYRPFFGNELMQLYQHPENVTKIPGYQAGMTAVERSMASQGYNGSGNMMASLQQYGGNFYNQAMQQLAGLSGANQTPGAGLVDAAKITSASQGVTAAGIGELIKAGGALFT